MRDEEIERQDVPSISEEPEDTLPLPEGGGDADPVAPGDVEPLPPPESPEPEERDAEGVERE